MKLITKPSNIIVSTLAVAVAAATSAHAAEITPTFDFELNTRETENPDLNNSSWGMGREVFSIFRNQVSGAEEGASIVF